MSEQPNTDSKAESKEPKSVEDFKGLSLSDMENELRSKNYSKETVKDQPDVDSEASDEDSVSTEQNDESTQETEKTSEEDDSDESSTESVSEEDNTTSENSDNQNDKKSKNSKKEKFDYEKAYKELQPEFTRRSQALKEMQDRLAALESKAESSPEKNDSTKKDNSRLAQLKEKDPEAAAALEELIQQEVDKRVDVKVKPVEEQVTLRRRKENTEKFTKAITEFQNSELKQLEPELLAIYNDNPSYWQKVIWDNDTAFDVLKKELISRHFDKAAELRANHLKNQKSDSTKKDRLKASQVGGKTKVTVPTKDVMSSDDFRKLPLSEMEKRLKRV